MLAEHGGIRRAEAAKAEVDSLCMQAEKRFYVTVLMSVAKQGRVGLSEPPKPVQDCVVGAKRLSGRRQAPLMRYLIEPARLVLRLYAREGTLHDEGRDSGNTMRLGVAQSVDPPRGFVHLLTESRARRVALSCSWHGRGCAEEASPCARLRVFSLCGRGSCAWSRTPSCSEELRAQSKLHRSRRHAIGQRHLGEKVALGEEEEARNTLTCGDVAGARPGGERGPWDAQEVVVRRLHRCDARLRSVAFIRETHERRPTRTGGRLQLIVQRDCGSDKHDSTQPGTEDIELNAR